MAKAAALAGNSTATLIGKTHGHSISENVAHGAALADALLLPAPTANVIDLTSRKAGR